MDRKSRLSAREGKNTLAGGARICVTIWPSTSGIITGIIRTGAVSVSVNGVLYAPQAETRRRSRRLPVRHSVVHRVSPNSSYAKVQ